MKLELGVIFQENKKLGLDPINKFIYQIIPKKKKTSSEKITKYTLTEM